MATHCTPFKVIRFALFCWPWGLQFNNVDMQNAMDDFGLERIFNNRSGLSLLLKNISHKYERVPMCKCGKWHLSLLLGVDIEIHQFSCRGNMTHHSFIGGVISYMTSVKRRGWNWDASRIQQNVRFLLFWSIERVIVFSRGFPSGIYLHSPFQHQ